MTNQQLPPITEIQTPSLNQSWVFLRLWQGRERLWKAFWLVGAVITISLVLSGIGMRAAGISEIQSRQIFFCAMSTVIYPCWSIFVWRCAWRSSHWMWAVLARIWAVMAILLSVALLAVTMIDFISNKYHTL